MAFERDRAARRAEFEAGRPPSAYDVLGELEQARQLLAVGGATAYRVAVFEETVPGG
ncbi:MAG: hypothetical protein M3471_00350 [Actinomycetota bacterium]|nr:hypothetical protein [Actinomycetota bacterium]